MYSLIKSLLELYAIFYHSHFIDVRTGAQRVQATCPVLHSQDVVILYENPRGRKGTPQHPWGASGLSA